MAVRKLRWLGLGLVATAGAGVMALTATMNPVLAYGEVPAGSADSSIGLVMGGSGAPLPAFDLPGYVQAANDLYIDNPLHPNFPGTTYPDPYANGLFTPEYPLLSMPFSINYPTATTGPLAGFPQLATSMGQGMLILENAIATNTAAGQTSTVFGWSQSATISGLVMEHLNPTDQPSDLPVQFVLIGNPSAPNGGLLERFDGLNLPSLGLSFDGATPANSFPTDIYTLEYDGYADFPKYPINFLADLNALLGAISIHGLYLNQELVPPRMGPTAEQIAHATLLPGSASLGTPDSLTDYYMIEQTPPLVTLLAGVPVIGKPLADLLGPDLTVLINLGYGADNLGYSTPANVPTPFGLFPDVNPATVFGELVNGAQQGFSAFVDDLSHLSFSSLVPELASGVSLVPTTDIVDGITRAIYSVSTLLYQTADIANAVLTTLPGYNLELFMDNLANPIDAIGLPIAADTGLLTLSAGFELELISEAIGGVISALTVPLG